MFWRVTLGLFFFFFFFKNNVINRITANFEKQRLVFSKIVGISVKISRNGFGSSGIVFNCAHFQSIRALQYFTDVLLTFFLFINALQLNPD